MKTFQELREARQMKDPKKDSMVQKGGKTIVIDKSKEKEYLKKGWSLAESVNLDEGKMKEFHDYIDQGKSAQWIAKKMGLDMKTVKELMADMKESVELSEAPDLEKMSNELLKHKSKGVNYEKAAAYVRTMFMNSSLSVQDKAMKGLLTLLKNMDLTDRTTITKILKDNGFKVKGGRLMRESVDCLKEALVKVTDIEVDYGDQMPKKPMRTIANEIKLDWDLQRSSIRAVVKKMGGLITGSEPPSIKNKWVGTLTISTRGDPSKLNKKSIQKAVIPHGIEVHDWQFKESVELTEKTTIDLAREVVKNRSAKYGLDMQTANLIIQVYDKVNDKNKKKMEKMNPAALGQAVWKMTGNK